MVESEKQYQEHLIETIKYLVEIIRLYHEKYGSEYIGGKSFDLILCDLENRGIVV